ncbi:ester cyclase [Streptomyces sp. Z38]|uniref:ester cyclase n=1 Tax=Streptomyces sp. Z38 TaxID=2682780 RepID=UPI001E55093F|nr:ester cyclase [Streptomyces sp. Z38]
MPSDARVAEAPARQQSVAIAVRDRNRSARSHDQPFSTTRGREIDCEQVHVLDLEEGRIVRHEAVRDDVTMLQQLGVFPPSPAVALRMAAWKVGGRAARAAEEVTRRAAEAASSA